MIHTKTTKHKNCVDEHEHSVQIKKRSGRNQKKKKIHSRIQMVKRKRFAWKESKDINAHHRWHKSCVANGGGGGDSEPVF